MRTPLATLLALNLIFAGGVAYPWLEDLAPILSGLALVFLMLVSRWRSIASRSVGWLRMALLVTPLVVLFGGLEYGAQIAMRFGWIEASGAMETLVPAGSADYRLAHIVGDRRREPDPLLWWRPSASAPYNAQRMKGPLAAIPKPAGRFRVLCYGDSNTDGSANESWPELLHARLEARDIEVLNAGVAGYTSHQGLLRFLEDVDRYQPDLVLVSFGWNDATPVVRRADHDFVEPSRFFVATHRTLIRFDFFRALLRAKRATEKSPGLRARVPLNRYLENLSRFKREAEGREVELVFLTRPFREPEAQSDLAQTHWPAPWIAQVPLYNAATIRYGETQDAIVIDVHGRIASARADRFADMAHWNAKGRRAMASFLDEALSARALLP